MRDTADEVIADCSRRAFAVVESNLAQAIADLSEIKGVGAATASAALAAFAPAAAPFFDSPMADQIADLGTCEYTDKFYLTYAAQLLAKARALGPDWTAHAVSQALWANSMMTK